MSWTSFPDKIFLVNLPSRKDRLLDSTRELSRYNIPFEVFEAIQDTENPRRGLRHTMFNLYRYALEQGYKRILVFEDDVRFLKNPNTYMPKCIEQLKETAWELLYLGVNPAKPFIRKFSENLLQIREGWSSHAVMYNENALTTLNNKSEELRDIDRPIDIILVENIQVPEGCYHACLVSYPMIATQRTGYSDIEKARVSYKSCLEDTYKIEAEKVI